MTAPRLRPLAGLALALAATLTLACAMTVDDDRSQTWMEAVLVFDG